MSTNIVSKWHENCSLFRFLSSQSAQNYLFCHVKFYEPQKYKIFISWWGWVGVFFPTFSFQVANQSSSDAQSVLFRFPLLHLWVFAFAFMMIYSYFYDEVVQYRLHPHGYSLEFVSDVDCNTFLPRDFYSKCENQLHSLREWSVFS